MLGAHTTSSSGVRGVGSEPTLLHNERCESSSHGIAFFRRVEVVKAIVAAAKLFARMAQTGRVGKRVFEHHAT